MTLGNYPCLWCHEETADTESVRISAAELNDDGDLVANLRWVHVECQLRQVAGSIGHLLRQCTCYQANGFDDIEELTPRENAKLVFAWVKTYGAV